MDKVKGMDRQSRVRLGPRGKSNPSYKVRSFADSLGKEYTVADILDGKVGTVVKDSPPRSSTPLPPPAPATPFCSRADDRNRTCIPIDQSVSIVITADDIIAIPRPAYAAGFSYNLPNVSISSPGRQATVAGDDEDDLPPPSPWVVDDAASSSSLPTRPSGSHTGGESASRPSSTSVGSASSSQTITRAQDTAEPIAAPIAPVPRHASAFLARFFNTQAISSGSDNESGSDSDSGEVIIPKDTGKWGDDGADDTEDEDKDNDEDQDVDDEESNDEDLDVDEEDLEDDDDCEDGEGHDDGNSRSEKSPVNSASPSGSSFLHLSRPMGEQDSEEKDELEIESEGDVDRVSDDESPAAGHTPTGHSTPTATFDPSSNPSTPHAHPIPIFLETGIIHDSPDVMDDGDMYSIPGATSTPNWESDTLSRGEIPHFSPLGPARLNIAFSTSSYDSANDSEEDDEREKKPGHEQEHHDATQHGISSGRALRRTNRFVRECEGIALAPDYAHEEVDDAQGDLSDIGNMHGHFISSSSTAGPSRIGNSASITIDTSRAVQAQGSGIATSTPMSSIPSTETDPPLTPDFGAISRPELSSSRPHLKVVAWWLGPPPVGRTDYTPRILPEDLETDLALVPPDIANEWSSEDQGRPGPSDGWG